MRVKDSVDEVDKERIREEDCFRIVQVIWM